MVGRVLTPGEAIKGPTDIRRPELLALLKDHGFRLLDDPNAGHVGYQHKEFSDITGGFAAHGKADIPVCDIKEAGRKCLEVHQRLAEAVEAKRPKPPAPAPPPEAIRYDIPDWATLTEREGKILLRHAIYPELGMVASQKTSREGMKASFAGLNDLAEEHIGLLRNLKDQYGIEVVTDGKCTRLVKEEDKLEYFLPPFAGAADDCLPPIRRVLEQAEELAVQCQIRKERYLEWMELVGIQRHMVSTQDGKTHWRIPFADIAVKATGRPMSSDEHKLYDRSRQAVGLIKSEDLLLDYFTDNRTGRIILPIALVEEEERDVVTLFNLLGGYNHPAITSWCTRSTEGNTTILTDRTFGVRIALHDTEATGSPGRSEETRSNVFSAIRLILNGKSLRERNNALDGIIKVVRAELAASAPDTAGQVTVTLRHKALNAPLVASADTKGFPSSKALLDAKESLTRQMLEQMTRNKQAASSPLTTVAEMTAAAQALARTDQLEQVQTEAQQIEDRLQTLEREHGFSMRIENTRRVFAPPGDDNSVKPICVADALDTNIRRFVTESCGEALNVMNKRATRVKEAVEKLQGAGFAAVYEQQPGENRGTLTITPEDDQKPLKFTTYGAQHALTKADVLAVTKYADKRLKGSDKGSAAHRAVAGRDATSPQI